MAEAWAFWIAWILQDITQIRTERGVYSETDKMSIIRSPNGQLIGTKIA